MSAFPFIAYQADYPNQVHQLNVSLSNHFYVLKNGDIKYQKKPFDINFGNYQKSEKIHVVHYLLRDHFSNAFYGEIHPTNELEDLKIFLGRAWSRKDGYLFCGISDYMVVPKTVQKFCPEIVSFLKSSDVEVTEATSGFQAGVRTLRTWEDELRFAISLDGDFQQIDNARKNIIYLCARINDRSSGKKESNILRWHKNIQKLKLPSGATV